MEELEINKLKLLLLAFLVITISSCIGSAAEINVHRGDSIQTAVNSASSGDTIIVDAGTYVGNIDLSKLDNLVLRSSSGNPADTIIIADNSVPASVKGVISVTKYKTSVTVNGFTISQARDGMAGVYIENSNHCTVENNIFRNDGLGVSISGGTGSNIVRNNIVNRTSKASSDSTYTGINIDNSVNTIVSQNTVTNNNNGVHLTRSTKGSSVTGNTLNSNTQSGIFLENVKGVTVDGNTLDSNELYGIDLAGSTENYVTNNDVTMVGVTNAAVNGTNTQGIQLIYTGTEDSPVGSDSNIVANNKVRNADHGIFVNRCKNNTIQNNRAQDNNYGIAMRYATNNRVINNNADGNTNPGGTNHEGIFLTYDDTKNTVSGNSASGCDRGIELSEVCGIDNVVDNNTVNSNNYYGILVQTHGNTVSNNLLTQNARSSIHLTGQTCYNNLVSNNTIRENSGNGINLINTSDYGNRIIGNRLISNGLNKGIALYNSNNSYLEGNFAHDNDMGVELQYSNGVKVTNNEADQNRFGIRIYYSSSNNVTGNKATNSTTGIDMNSATYNNITGNSVTLNDVGISMCAACHDNLVYNNYFSNTGVNTHILNAQNTWYTVKTQGKNIMKGPYIGGNFWGLPDGSGFSQTAPDTNGDGISDNMYTYTNPSGITISDLYPLVSVIVPVPDFSFIPAQGPAPLTVQFSDKSQNTDSRTWNFGDGSTSNELNPAHTYSTAGTYTAVLAASNKNSTEYKSATITVQEYVALPVADFSASPTSGTSPLNVQFTDNSQNAVAWSWDFGDGATSNEKNPSHTFNGVTTYTVTLTASNANGQASKQTAITVSSGGHSGGGGGGGGGSPEPQNNVQIKELAQTFIASGKSAKFDFPQQATAVVSIGFNSKKTAGKTTTIVEMLKDKSTLVSGVPADEVYRYLNIWVGNSGFATEKNIENSVLSFKVEKSWVQDKKIDKTSITLNRYSDKAWNALSTSLTGEDVNYLYFTAQTPGFSPFAITGKSTASIQPAASKAEPPVNVAQSNMTSGSTAENTQKTPAQSENKTSSPKQSTSVPGFEAVFGVVGLLAVFLYSRK